MTAGSILAALNVDLPKQNRSFGPGSSLLFDDVLLIVGLGLGLLLILSAGIYLWMKTRRKRRKHVTGGEKVYRGHEHGTDALEQEAEEEIEESDADEGDDSDDHHDHQGGDHAHDKRRYKYPGPAPHSSLAQPDPLRDRRFASREKSGARKARLIGQCN